VCDQLRWQLGPTLSVILDGKEGVSAEILGHSAPILHIEDLAEVVRQLMVQQRGDGHPGDDPILMAEIARRAAFDRMAAVRDHITDAIAEQLPRGLAVEVADTAMTGMGPLFMSAVTSAADSVLRQLADHPDWRDVLNVRIRADDAARLAAMHGFIASIAFIMKDGERGSDGMPTTMSSLFASEQLRVLITEARTLVGTLDPQGSSDSTGDPIPPTADPDDDR
jgi:hypothetical protein